MSCIHTMKHRNIVVWWRALATRYTLHLFLTILTIYVWDGEIMILANNFSEHVEHKLSFSLFGSPVLRRWHIPWSVLFHQPWSIKIITFCTGDALFCLVCFFKPIKWDTVVLIRAVEECHYWLNLVTLDLDHEVRLVSELELELEIENDLLV